MRERRKIVSSFVNKLCLPQLNEMQRKSSKLILKYIILSQVFGSGKPSRLPGGFAGWGGDMLFTWELRPKVGMNR
jgi:hypothetical protein